MSSQYPSIEQAYYITVSKGLGNSPFKLYSLYSYTSPLYTVLILQYRFGDNPNAFLKDLIKFE